MAEGVTRELVEAAYQALATGDRKEVAKYWAEDMRWCVPGNHQLAGWWEGLDGFFSFMEQVGKLSGGSFVMTRSAVLLTDNMSADVSFNIGDRTLGVAGQQVRLRPTSRSTSSTCCGGATARSSKDGERSSATAPPSSTSSGLSWPPTLRALGPSPAAGRPGGCGGHQ